MSHRCLTAVFTVIAVVALTPLFAAAQSTNTTAQPRTPWGDPDLQGVWNNGTIAPLQRPDELADKEFLTEEEAANLEQARIARNERLLHRPARRTKAGANVDRGGDGAPGFYNNLWLGLWHDNHGAHVADHRSAEREAARLDTRGAHEAHVAGGAAEQRSGGWTQPRRFMGGPTAGRPVYLVPWDPLAAQWVQQPLSHRADS